MFTLILQQSHIFCTTTDYFIESDHPYANNFEYTWPAISRPDATQMRLHFTKVDLANYDNLILIDKDGKQLGQLKYEKKEDYWTSWYTGDTLKIKLQTDGSYTGYGFKIDQVETRTDVAPSSDLPESYHPYANNFEYTWPAISRPDATQMRLHFTKVDLANYDNLILIDKDGKQLGQLKYEKKEDYWTSWYTGDTLKIKLQTDGSYTGYGFKIDQVETRKGPTETPMDTVVETPTETMVETPTETPAGKTEVSSASVSLQGEKTNVFIGEEIRLKLSAVNLITKPIMHVQVIIIPPSGMSVSSSELVDSGAGQYTTTYDLEPGKGKDIEVKILANQVGNFDVKGRAVYYFGDNKKNTEDYVLNLPIQVEELDPKPTPSTPEPTPSTPGSPGLGLSSLLFILMMAFILKMKHT